MELVGAIAAATHSFHDWRNPSLSFRRWACGRSEPVIHMGCRVELPDLPGQNVTLRAVRKLFKLGLETGFFGGDIAVKRMRVRSATRHGLARY
jgi:hypothetical protein